MLVDTNEDDDADDEVEVVVFVEQLNALISAGELTPPLLLLLLLGPLLPPTVELKNEDTELLEVVFKLIAKE